ncbi:hypothetical protein ABZX85_15965 [Streptomyces sp. NPDC004539]|uniref:hypothetical protein n=1 Tax=Streptomyces sp. NPDC004539 TaxID=3154280 RepID=UPI00339DEF25
MRAASVSRGSHSAHRAGVVLALALITLVHVFGCAHGPTAAEPSRADTLVLMSSAACHPHAAELPHQHGTESHCSDSDDPPVHPPRDYDPTGSLGPGTAAGAVPAAAPAAAASLPHLAGAPPPPLPPGNDRARLGVWRT